MDAITRTQLKLRVASPFFSECVTTYLPREPMSVLDAPCGFGRHSMLMANLGHKVTSVDIDAQRVDSFCSMSSEFKEVCSGIVHNLDVYADQWCSKFDMVIVVDFWSEKFVRLLSKYIKSGGYLLLETVGNRAGNWLELPRPRQVIEIIEPHFQLIVSKIAPAGPTKSEAETAKILAKRR